MMEYGSGTVKNKFEVFLFGAVGVASLFYYAKGDVFTSIYIGIFYGCYLLSSIYQNMSK